MQMMKTSQIWIIKGVSMKILNRDSVGIKLKNLSFCISKNKILTVKYP